MTERKGGEWREGVDDFVAHRLEYFVPLTISVVVVCGLFALLGYAFDRHSSFQESASAGIGLLVGLGVWMAALTAFIGRGGASGIKRRRRRRRHAEHVDAIRGRRS